MVCFELGPHHSGRFPCPIVLRGTVRFDVGKPYDCVPRLCFRLDLTAAGAVKFVSLPYTSDVMVRIWRFSLILVQFSSTPSLRR